MLDRETSSRGVPVSSCSLTRSRREARLTAKNGNYPGAPAPTLFRSGLVARWTYAGIPPGSDTFTTVREVRQVATQWRNRAAHVTPLARCIQCSPQMARASLTRFPESGQLFRHRVNPPQSPAQPEAGSGMYVEDLHGRMVGATWTSVATPSSKCGVSQPPDC